MKHNLDLNDLYLFVQVVDAGSFSEASRRLNIPKATISRRMAKLEKKSWRSPYSTQYPPI